MSEKSNGLYAKADMVDVVDEAGNAIPGMPSVPKSWLGTALVPTGTKKGKPKAAEDSTATPAPEARKEGEEPKGNASAKEWEAYAREKGATDEDLLDDVGEPLTRDALKDKYGTKS